MSHRVIDPDDLEPTPGHDRDRRPVGEVTGFEFALNRHAAEPDSRHRAVVPGGATPMAVDAHPYEADG